MGRSHRRERRRKRGGASGHARAQERKSPPPQPPRRPQRPRPCALSLAPPQQGGGGAGGAGSGGFSQKSEYTRSQLESSAANKESFFARKIEENASRPDHLPPSQGGKYVGFGSSPAPQPRKQNAGEQGGPSSSLLHSLAAPALCPPWPPRPTPPSSRPPPLLLRAPCRRGGGRDSSAGQGHDLPL